MLPDTTPDPADEPTGKLLIFTAPSGAGKTTIVRHLLKTFDELAFSVSATNRPIREGETDGKSYHFLTTAEFKAKVATGEFVEYEEVYPGRMYGTLRSEIERLSTPATQRRYSLIRPARKYFSSGSATATPRVKRTWRFASRGQGWNWTSSIRLTWYWRMMS